MRIARLGYFARGFLAHHTRARVSATFARSFHLEVEDDALCVVDPSLGDGALNAVLADPIDASLGIAVGASCTIDNATIVITPTLAIDFSSATDWAPIARMRRPSEATLRAFLDAAIARAPRDGAFRSMFDRSFQPDTPMQRAMTARVQGFASWLAKRPAGTEAPVAGLIGLGSGLTPAGDDFVGGVMIALHSRCVDEMARAVWSAIAALGSAATTVLSRSMLRAAAEGVGGAALHDMLEALGANDLPRATLLLGAIDRIGHTSGWDALAGAMAIAFLGRHPGASRSEEPGTHIAP